MDASVLDEPAQWFEEWPMAKPAANTAKKQELKYLNNPLSRYLLTNHLRNIVPVTKLTTEVMQN